MTRKQKWRGQLKRNRINYEKNFKMLELYIDDEERKKPYVKRERILEKRCISLQKKLGIFVPNPCPLNGNKHCIYCTGWTESRICGERFPQVKRVMCDKGTGFECLLSHFSEYDTVKEIKELSVYTSINV